jgi:MFS family permease
MVFAGFLSGTVAETFNRKYIVVASIIGQALCTVGIGFSTAFYQVLLARLLLGVTSGFFVPAMLGLVVDYFPERGRTTAIALTSVVLP